MDKVLYKRMSPFIYGSRESYITEDEHKIDESEFACVVNICESLSVDYFYSFTSRVIPERFTPAVKLDRVLTRALSGAGRVTAGRIVFEGQVAK